MVYFILLAHKMLRKNLQSLYLVVIFLENFIKMLIISLYFEKAVIWYIHRYFQDRLVFYFNLHNLVDMMIDCK